VQHEATALDGFAPSFVGTEIGANDFKIAGQAGASRLGEMLRQNVGHLTGPTRRSRGAADAETGLGQLDDAVLCDESGCASNQNTISHGVLLRDAFDRTYALARTGRATEVRFTTSTADAAVRAVPATSADP
jgi:hypothetical protein